MSLLTLIKSAAYKLTIEAPGTVINNTDPTALQLLTLANEEGRALAKRHPWQKIRQEHTFTTTAAAAQTGSVPTDFDRMIPETMFNRTTKRRVTGELSADEWQQAQATVSATINQSFCFRGGTILISPTPPADQTVAYECNGRRDDQITRPEARRNAGCGLSHLPAGGFLETG